MWSTSGIDPTTIQSQHRVFYHSANPSWDLASEIKIKTNEKLFQNFQISQLESVKKNPKFKDGDGIILKVGEEFLKFDGKSFSKNKDPSIFFCQDFEENEDEFVSYLKFQGRCIGFTSKSGFLLCGQSKATKFIFQRIKEFGTLKIVFNKNNLFLNDKIEFEKDGEPMKIQWFKINEIINKIEKDSNKNSISMHAGHLIPGDFGGFIAQFSHDKSNIHTGCPQLSYINTGIWKKVEKQEKDLVKKYKYIEVKKYVKESYWVCVFIYKEDGCLITETYVVPNWSLEIYNKILENNITMCQSKSNGPSLSTVLEFLEHDKVKEMLVTMKFS
jgi:hypothetical protein